MSEEQGKPSKVTEVRQEIRTIQVDFVCQDCQKGYMKFTHCSHTARRSATGRLRESYDHRCPECNATVSLPNKYPYTEYLPAMERVADQQVFDKINHLQDCIKLIEGQIGNLASYLGQVPTPIYDGTEDSNNG